MTNKIQIGTICYKENDEYTESFALNIEETQQLIYEKKNLMRDVTEMFVLDLFDYSVVCGLKISKKTNSEGIDYV